MASWRKQGWLLKNSSAGRGPELRRVRMPYKRFSRVAQAFSIPQNHAVFVDIDFFNTHRAFHLLRRSANPLADWPTPGWSANRKLAPGRLVAVSYSWEP